MGYASDYTAVCGVGKIDNKIFSVDHKIYIPTKTEEFRFDDVKRYLIELSKIYDIQSLLFDPYQAIQLSQDLEKEGINMVKLTPTTGNSVAFSQCLFNLIKSQGINFYESEEIRLSLINCKVIYSTRGWRIVKKSGTKKIDLAIALAMASYGAVIAPEESESIIEWKSAGRRPTADQDW
ncbi:hypothetical protein ES708_11158 [subsurface metagenome]